MAWTDMTELVIGVAILGAHRALARLQIRIYDQGPWRESAFRIRPRQREEQVYRLMAIVVGVTFILAALWRS